MCGDQAKKKGSPSSFFCVTYMLSGRYHSFNSESQRAADGTLEMMDARVQTVDQDFLYKC
jgi:hypothetical protein